MRRATRPRFPPEAKPLPAHAQSPPNPVCLNQPLIRHRENGDSLLPAFFALRPEHHRETHKASPSKSPRPAAKAQSSRARSSFALRAQSIAAKLPAREDPSLLPGNRESSVKPADEWELRLDPLSSLHRQLDRERPAPASLPQPSAEVAAPLCRRCASAESPAPAWRSSASEY